MWGALKPEGGLSIAAWSSGGFWQRGRDLGGRFLHLVCTFNDLRSKLRGQEPLNLWVTGLRRADDVLQLWRDRESTLQCFKCVNLSTESVYLLVSE